MQNVIPDIDSFYAHFEAPGVAHCIGGVGAYPLTAFPALVEWVENPSATPPSRLDALTLPNPGEDTENFRPTTRPLCPYPKVAAYVKGDPKDAGSFACKEGFGVEAGKGKVEL